MKEVTRITLENDMDVVVAQRRMMSVASFFSLSLSTQTTIATAVAEVSREVIDKTDSGLVIMGMEESDGKFFLCANISFTLAKDDKLSEAGLEYARRLVPEFIFIKGLHSSIAVQIGIPRSFKINNQRINEAAEAFKIIEPTSPYEKLKLRNVFLSQQSIEKDEELLQKVMADQQKNEFISIVSHELKSPLTTIKAFTQLALASCEDNPREIKPYLEKMNGQVGKLQLLIEQLLDVSKMEAGKLDYDLQATDWGTYLNELMPLLEHLVPDHKLTRSECEEKVSVKIDVLRMEQVFTNLVDNAAKYSPKASGIHISCKVENNLMNVCVRDQGVGIPQEDLAVIFEKYFRASGIRKSHSGFGMGLYITSSIIKEHGGSIYAESNGKGSSIHFTLPLSN